MVEIDLNGNWKSNAKGIADTCNMGFDFLVTKYDDSVKKIALLIKKMAALTGSFESVAVAGFSQGGQVATDAALSS